MGIISFFRDLAKNSMSYDQLKDHTKGIKGIAAEVILLHNKSSQYSETFEQALQRLNLTQADIDNRSIDFKRLVILFSVIGLCLFSYLIYAIFQKALVASLGTFGILLVVIAQLFRYHFWLFQIRQKKLGCTFKEWLNYLLGKNV